MEKVLFASLVLCASAGASGQLKQGAVHPVATKTPEYTSVNPNSFTPVTCSSEDEAIRNQIIEEAECGEPKNILVPLMSCVTYEKITPDLVWLKRCEGHCDYHAPDYKCMATETIIRHIPIRITNVETDREKCSTYEVEEHLSCACCKEADGTCRQPVLNPGHCTCSCSGAKTLNNSTSNY